MQREMTKHHAEPQLYTWAVIMHDWQAAKEGAAGEMLLLE